MVPGPLVETKLYVPQIRPGLVARPRLTALLTRGAESRMTLVSAPAGFGKTTLLAEWHGAGVAWLSVDAADSEPESFWTHVITALQRAAAGVGEGVLSLPQQPIETVLAPVINDLNGLTGHLDLVLDDYHLADGPGIQGGMTYLLEHLPPQVHLVISTRADPALPLARLRARGELVEIRAADLRFTPDEATTYLDEAVGSLTPSDIEALEQRTEGWIAALQLAALSLRGRDDVAAFIAGFAGDDRYVVDYLVEEVLQRQSSDVRDFLLRTSVLERLSGPLCDAVTGLRGGKAMLESLDRANLFVVPLDDNRRWYRYHHLFADVLRTHLLDEYPDEVPDLHRRASEWYDAAGEPVPAVSHAVQAGDFDRAADLVERAIPALRRDRQEATIRGWIDDLPDEVVRVRPVLAVGLIGGLMARGEFDTVETRLEDVERLMSSGAEMIVADPAEFTRMLGAMEMYRSALSLVRGDPVATATHAERAIERAAEDDYLVRSGASALAGLARWGMGDLDAASAAYSTAIEGLLRAGYVSDVLGCSITLADLRITQGRLGDAQRTYERGLQLSSGVLRGTPDMYVGLSQIAYERGDLAAAAEHLRHALEFGEPAGLPQNPYRRRVAEALLLDAEGNHSAALGLLDEAERVYTGDFSPDVRPIAATRARLLVARGNVSDAVAWARSRELSADDDLSYLREYEHITLARILIAQGLQGDAVRLLQRLLDAASAGGRTGSVIEILVLQALADHSLAPLERAVTLAEPEGYVRVFSDVGPTTLSTLARQHPYARLLAAADSRAATKELVAPLSDRELDVLRLLATDLDGPDIARRLNVSVTTVRTHTQHIYAKLGVNNRRAAVRQARQLNLLPRA